MHGAQEDHAQERPAQTDVVDGRTMKAHKSKGNTQGNAPWDGGKNGWLVGE